MATDQRRRALLATLTGVYSFYEKELTEFHFAVWQRALEDFDMEVITSAFDAHMMDPESGKWMPKPADIAKLLHGTRAERSAVAWGLVLHACQRVGAYASVAFDDPVVHCVIEDLGGWPAVCRVQIDELPFLEARFHKAYAAHAKAGTQHPPRLVGITDASNGLRGFGHSDPVLIGDPKRAALTLTTGSTMPRASIARASDVLALAGGAVKALGAPT